MLGNCFVNSQNRIQFRCQKKLQIFRHEKFFRSSLTFLNRAPKNTKILSETYTFSNSFKSSSKVTSNTVWTCVSMNYPVLWTQNRLYWILGSMNSITSLIWIFLKLSILLRGKKRFSCFIVGYSLVHASISCAAFSYWLVREMVKVGGKSLHEEAVILEDFNKGLNVTLLVKKYCVANSTFCSVKKNITYYIVSLNISLFKASNGWL